MPISSSFQNHRLYRFQGNQNISTQITHFIQVLLIITNSFVMQIIDSIESKVDCLGEHLNWLLNPRPLLRPQLFSRLSPFRLYPAHPADTHSARIANVASRLSQSGDLTGSYAHSDISLHLRTQGKWQQLLNDDRLSATIASPVETGVPRINLAASRL